MFIIIILAIMLAASAPLARRLSAQSRVVHEGLGLQVEFGRWKQLAGVLQPS